MRAGIGRGHAGDRNVGGNLVVGDDVERDDDTIIGRGLDDHRAGREFDDHLERDDDGRLRDDERDDRIGRRVRGRDGGRRRGM
jgi:hypothetical protein